MLRSRFYDCRAKPRGNRLTQIRLEAHPVVASQDLERVTCTHPPSRASFSRVCVLGKPSGEDLEENRLNGIEEAARLLNGARTDASTPRQLHNAYALIASR